MKCNYKNCNLKEYFYYQLINKKTMKKHARISFSVLSLLMGLVIIFASSCSKDEDADDNGSGGSTALIDADGNEYTFVTIGSQTWMAENLRTTKLNDGTPLTQIEDCTSDNKSFGFAFYDNNPVVYGETYGGLYNWYAASSGKLCPEGWRVPTKFEWEALVNYLGGALEAGKALKESGTTHWQSPNEATNQSGFGGLPGGYFGGVG